MSRIFALTISSLVFFLIVIYKSSLFKISKIECISKKGQCDKEIVDVLDGLRGESFAGIEGRVSDLLSQNLKIQDFSVLVSVPNKLKVRVYERDPVVAVKTQGSDNLFNISKEGFVLSSETTSVLPKIILFDEISYTIGDVVEKRIQTAINMMILVSNFFGSNEAQLSGQTLSVKVETGTKVFFSTTNDAQISVAALQLVYDRIKMSQKPKEIDLRFKNAILRY